MAKDIFNVQRGVVGRGVGDDTYIISPALVDAGANIIISDASGLNTVQLIGGLQIASSRVASTALELTLSNGAKVTVLGAQNFQYIVGGNPLTGDSPAATSFAAFTSGTLGVTVPTSGLASGTAKSIGVDMFDQADLDAAAASSEALAAAEAEVAELTEDLADAQAELATTATDLTAAQAQVTVLTTDLATVTATRDALQSDLDTLNADYDALLASSAVTATDLLAAQAEITALQTSLGAATAQVNTLTAQLSAANAQIATLEGDLADAENTIEDLEALVDQYENAVPTSAALTSGNDSFTGTGAGDSFTAAAGAVSDYDTVTDGIWGDGDTLSITADDDLGEADGVNVINIENVNITLQAATTSTGDLNTFDIDAHNIAKTNFVIDVAGASSVNMVDISGVASGSSITTGSAITQELNITTDDGADLTVTTAAEDVEVYGTNDNPNDLTLTLTTTEDYVYLETYAEGTVDITITGSAEFEADIDYAESVTIVNEAGRIYVDTDVATEINLTAKTDIDLHYAEGAFEATLSAGLGDQDSLVDSDSIEVLNLSGNGSVPTFDLSSAPNVSTIRVSGADDVNVRMDLADLAAQPSPMVLTDSSSAVTTMILEGASGTVDLSKVGSDFIRLEHDNKGETLTFASTDELIVATDLSAQTFDGLDASSSTNTLNITLNDADFDDLANATPDLNGLTLTDFRSVTIYAGVDDFRATITDLDGTADNTNVTINAGLNGVTVATSLDIGTGALVVNSGGLVDARGADVTAASLTVNGVGALKIDDIDSGNLGTVTTDQGNDVIQVTTTTSAMSISTKSGDDEVWLDGSTTAAQKYTIDFGAGTGDTLALSDTQTYAALSVAASNYEVLALRGTGAAGIAVTVGSDMVSGKALTVTNDDAGGTHDITVTLAPLVVNANFSGLNFDAKFGDDDDLIVTHATPAGVTLTGANVVNNIFTTAGGNDVLTGGDGEDVFVSGAGNDVLVMLAGDDDVDAGAGNDTINGGAGDDTILGGDGNDVIVAGEGADEITGGMGQDNIDLAETVEVEDIVYYLDDEEGSAAGTIGGTFTGFDIITGFEKGDDEIDVSAIGSVYEADHLDATNPLNDLSLSNYTNVNQVVNFMNDAGVGYDPNSGTGDAVIAITIGTGVNAITAIYAVDSADAVVEASEVYLLATLDDLFIAGDIV